jgi:hypothetical protein
MAAADLAHRIAEVQRALGRDAAVTVMADPDLAVAAALERHGQVCVAGSIFLVGAVRDALRRRAILH